MRHTNRLASIITAAGLWWAPLWCASMDNSFVQKAAEGGAAEIQMAQLAQTKASSQAVKEFANKLVADHTKANDNLKPIATKDNITWPTGMSAKDQAEYNRLQALSGAEFDRAFVNHEIKGPQGGHQSLPEGSGSRLRHTGKGMGIGKSTYVAGASSYGAKRAGHDSLSKHSYGVVCFAEHPVLLHKAEV